MKLLIITQKVDENDDILGFFHCWLEEFSKYCEKLTVICLEKGEFHLPDNVQVLSLGKESGKSRLKYLFNFYKYIFQERKNYDAVFVHMNPEYVVLGGLFWKLWGKKSGFWYVHKKVHLTLRLAEKFVDKIFTASPESFRLKSKKIAITGHGIDVEKFKVQSLKFKITDKNTKFKILTAGRIAPVKNYELLIEVAEILKKERFDFEIRIAGGPILEQDKIYFEKLKNIIKEKGLEDRIIFVGAIPNKNIADFYAKGDLFVNFSDTGSMDKAVLEAMASGLLVLTSNEAFKNILSEKYFTSKDSEEIAEKIMNLSKFGNGSSLADYVAENHDLEKLVQKIIKEYE